MTMAHTLVHGQVSLHLVAVGGKSIAYLPLLRVRRLMVAASLIVHSRVLRVRHVVTALFEHHLVVHALKVGQVLVLILGLLWSHRVSLHLHDLTLPCAEWVVILHRGSTVVGSGLVLLALWSREVQMMRACLWLVLLYLLNLQSRRLFLCAAEYNHVLWVTCAHLRLWMSMGVLDIVGRHICHLPLH